MMDVGTLIGYILERYRFNLRYKRLKAGLDSL